MSSGGALEAGALSILEDDPLWYKDAIFYELPLRAFYDSNGDGVGDFPGLIEKLDYLQDLGITAIWLLPFYPSPMRDGGYDIVDHRAVSPEYGTQAHVRRFIREAHRRGIRVIFDLVANHTSDRHPWFQRARRAPRGSVWRDYYVWSDTPDRFSGVRVIFQDFEESNWTWDPVAGQYYWHRFYHHQPDLNLLNPRVQKEILRIADHWLRMGVDGFRLDAVPYLVEKDGTTCEGLPETHEVLRRLHAHIDSHYPNRLLLAEANQRPIDAVNYFGQGDECHMVFNFPVMPRLFLAVRTEDKLPLQRVIEEMPPIPENCQWGMFLRNHDELTLEMVDPEERQLMWDVYAVDTEARINLGIRRRLAPLLGNHRRRIELMNALLLSLPGSPVIYYGDELGMGDNVYLDDRNGLRTPMQWSADRNAGFSRAPSQRLYLPVLNQPEYHYGSVNVELQLRHPHSLLLWMKRLIGLRRRYPAFSRGDIRFLDSETYSVLAYLRTLGEQVLLVVANLSRYVRYANLDLAQYRGWTPVELYGETRFPAVAEGRYFMSLGPHSFYWFRLEPPPG